MQLPDGKDRRRYSGDEERVTCYDVACSAHAGRWHATVIDPCQKLEQELLHVVVDRLEQVPFAAADVLAARRGFRPGQLRLLGLNLTAAFSDGHTEDRHRMASGEAWTDSYTAIHHGLAVLAVFRSQPAG